MKSKKTPDISMLKKIKIVNWSISILVTGHKCGEWERRWGVAGEGLSLVVQTLHSFCLSRSCPLDPKCQSDQDNLSYVFTQGFSTHVQASRNLSKYATLFL